MKQDLELFLQSRDYKELPVGLDDYAIYSQSEHHCIHVICIVDATGSNIISADYYWRLKHKIIELFRQEEPLDIHFMTIVLADAQSRSLEFLLQEPFCWKIDLEMRRLCRYEDSVEDFYGLKNELETFLNHGFKKAAVFPVVSFLLFAVNVLLFLICTFTGNLLYNIGALSLDRVMNAGEAYRMITSMFLHWDINHLVSNMLILFFAGDMVEKEFGRGRFLLLYLFAGLSGSAVSLAYELYSTKLIVSVGASGAIYGLIGCLLVLVFLNNGRYGEIKLTRVLLVIAYLLYSGFADPYVNNAAHIGGFIGGALITLPIWFIRKSMNKKREVSA